MKKAPFVVIMSLALMGYAAAQDEKEQEKPGIGSQTGAAAGQAAAATAGTAVAGPIGGAVAGVLGGTVGGAVGKVVDGDSKNKKTCDRDDKNCETQVAQGSNQGNSQANQQDNQQISEPNQQTAQQ